MYMKNWLEYEYIRTLFWWEKLYKSKDYYDDIVIHDRKEYRQRTRYTHIWPIQTKKERERTQQNKQKNQKRFVEKIKRKWIWMLMEKMEEKEDKRTLLQKKLDRLKDFFID